MPTSDQKKNIDSAIDAFNTSLNLLNQRIDVATDEKTAENLTKIAMEIELQMSRLANAKNSADDESFAAATATLQSTASNLKTDEAKMQVIIKDVKTAATVVSYITQGLAYIAKL